MFDVVVIGGGIMGAPAARYLADEGLSVAVVAPPEPTGDNASGPFGAHYDAARLTWIHHPDDVETELSRRSIAAIDEIERHADAPIFSRSGHLFIVESGVESARLSAADAALETGAMVEIATDDAARRFPGLSIPTGARLMWEPPPSGWFDPRALVAAQLRGATTSGAEILASPAVAVRNRSVELRNGTTIQGVKVLVANGAYVNTPRLLPRPVALRLKTETVLMAEVGHSEAERLSGLPPIIYALNDPGVDDVYTAPPLRYPDGRFLMKWGANTITDRWVGSPDEIDAWYRAGTDREAIGIMQTSMLRTFPGLAVEKYHTMHCVVAYTGHGMPYIDIIEPGRLYIAAGGNGHSAKWSAALGRLAASLVLNDVWVDPLPGHRFNVQWAGEVDSWVGKDLLAERRR